MNAVTEKYRSVAPQPTPTPNPQPQPRNKALLFLLICAIFGIFVAWKGADFLELDQDGNVQISAQRKGLLNKRLKRLKQAEQYVLLAERDGWYPCYDCGNNTKIYLLAGEVWRYGITIRGERGRYGPSLKSKRLVYVVQFRGTIQDCLSEEAIKIYTYPVLPENLKRTIPLIRPPGNKVDL